MAEPFFDIAVERLPQVDLRLRLPADPGQGFASTILTWFGDQYLANPQLDDLLHLTVCGHADANPIFDTATDGIEPLRRPAGLVAAQPRSTGSHSPAQDAIELVLMDVFASETEPAPHGGCGRMVWIAGAGSFERLPRIHRDWSAGRTVADESADGGLLLRVCADLVRAAMEGTVSTGPGWVASPALSRILRGTGYAVG